MYMYSSHVVCTFPSSDRHLDITGCSDPSMEVVKETEDQSIL